MRAGRSAADGDNFGRLSGMSRRTAVVLVMLIAMLWQSVALARIGSSVNVLADREHAALHWHDQAHHHHDDGSYQKGDGGDSTRHLLGDQVGSTTALLCAAAQVIPAVGSSAPVGLQRARLPDPLLDGPLRPPRRLG